jgi:hypothetical protein
MTVCTEYNADGSQKFWRTSNQLDWNLSEKVHFSSEFFN